MRKYDWSVSLNHNTIDLKLINASIVWSWDLWLQIIMILKFLGFKISVKLRTNSDTERNKLNSSII